jgi:hypothetical protein
MAISNKTLAILLIGAIAISLFGTFVSLNRIAQIGVPAISGGATTGAGQARLTIKTQLSIVLNDSIIDYGNCTPDVAPVYWDTNDTARAGSGAGQCTNLTDPQNITVENDGNELANVSVKSSIIDLTGGSSPTFWFATDNSTDGRKGCSQGLRRGWTQFAVADTEYTSCDGLNFSDSMDRYYTFFRVYGPTDATAGQRTATITFTAYGW